MFLEEKWWVRAVFWLLVIGLWGCESSVESSRPFARNVVGSFNPKNVNAVEQLVENYAQSNGYRTIAKDRESMSYLTKGMPAFLIFIYLPDNDLPFITIGNVGVGEKLSISLIDHDYLIPTESKYEELIAQLSSKALIGNVREVN